MSKELRFTGSFRLDLLLDELLAAFPDWIVEDGEGNRQILVALFGDLDRTQNADDAPENAIIIRVPDDAGETAIAAVIAAHDSHGSTVAENTASQVRALAASVVGVALTSLTTEQVRAVVALLLLDTGALDENLVIKPLDEWTGYFSGKENVE